MGLSTWHDNDYGYAKVVTLTNPASDLTDFPFMLFRDNDTDMNTSKVLASLNDFRVYDHLDNLLSQDPVWMSADGTDGDVRCNIKVPNLYASPSGDENKVKVYYGYGSATLKQDTGTYRAALKGVWHCNNSNPQTSVDDSTSNGFDFNSNAAGLNLSSTSLFDNSTQFINTSSEYARRAAAIQGTGDFTFTCLARTDNTSVNEAQFFLGDASAGDKFWSCRFDSGGNFRFTHRDGSATHAVTSNSYTNNTWYHCTAIYDSGDLGQELKAILNAVHASQGTANVSGGWPTGVDRTAIGRSDDSSPTSPLDGYLNECRFYAEVLTADYLTYEYQNLLGSGTNYQSWGAEQTKPAAGGGPPQRTLTGVGL